MFLRSMLASLSEKVEHMEKTAVGKIGKLSRERERERERERGSSCLNFFSSST